jgi:hypothetical protein
LVRKAYQASKAYNANDEDCGGAEVDEVVDELPEHCGSRTFHGEEVRRDFDEGVLPALQYPFLGQTTAKGSLRQPRITRHVKCLRYVSSFIGIPMELEHARQLSFIAPPGRGCGVLLILTSFVPRLPPVSCLCPPPSLLHLRHLQSRSCLPRGRSLLPCLLPPLNTSSTSPPSTDFEIDDESENPVGLLLSNRPLRPYGFESRDLHV